jgi:hypothetical protein
MINRDDIEAGDKCFTRDGGCLVASSGEDGIYVFGQLVQDYWNHDLTYTNKGEHPLDIIRIEKAPKPVVVVRYLGFDIGGCSIHGEHGFAHEWPNVMKLTYVNGKLEKSEQVK